MYFKLFLLIACSVLLETSARSVRDTAKVPDTFAEVFETVNENFSKLKTTVLESFGVENTDQLQDKALSQGKEFASKLDVWAQDIKKETESLKDHAAVKKLRETVDSTIEDLKAKHPETAADLKTYVDKANKQTEEIVGKLKALSESQDAKNLQDLSKNLLESAAATFQKIASQIQEDIKKN